MNSNKDARAWSILNVVYQLYNFSQYVITSCLVLIIIICNACTQIPWCELYNCSSHEHIQCEYYQIALMLSSHMYGLCDESMCNYLVTLTRLCCN